MFTRFYILLTWACTYWFPSSFSISLPRVVKRAKSLPSTSHSTYLRVRVLNANVSAFWYLISDPRIPLDRIFLPAIHFFLPSLSIVSICPNQIIIYLLFLYSSGVNGNIQFIRWFLQKIFNQKTLIWLEKLLEIF